MDIKSLFGVKSQTNAPTTAPNEGKQSSETYQQWGHRMAGLSQGNVPSIDTHLQIVYQNIRREQENDANLQNQIQQEIEQNIARSKQNLEHEENVLQTIQDKIKDVKEKIENISNSIDNLKGQVQRKNAEARANFIIGLCIIIPLTIYLFIFYSSTAYSAFFKEIDYTQALGSHMFDAQALTASWQQSGTAVLFVLLITFIFMALGFILHQFTKQEGSAKYIKVGSIIVVTFVFDTLLAYLIAKNMYDAEALTKLETPPPYTLSMAFTDARFWIVIFCGFLAYIIWGLLFGFVMDSYNHLDLNKVEKESLKKQLNKLQVQEQEEKTALANQKEAIAKIKGDITTLEARKTRVTVHDYTAILLELNHFFAGWLQYMNGAAKPQTEIVQANSIFNNFVQPIKSRQQNYEQLNIRKS